MKLLIPFVFVAATIVGVAVQLMPTRQERASAEIDEIMRNRDAANKRFKEESDAKWAKTKAKLDEESEHRQQALDAFVQAAKDCVRQAVVSRLKAPATAQFGPIEFRNPEWIPKNTLNLESWVGYGYVDSQNSFGALLRQKYEVYIVVNKEARRWEVTGSVQFFDN